MSIHTRSGHGNPAAMAPSALAIVGATFVVHIVVALVTEYGIHRDEFLYLAMGRHLQLWRMDFPPLIAMLANAELLLTGGELWLRLLPALGHAALVLVAIIATALLGGERGAQWLAACAVLFPPLFLRTGSLFQPVVFDQLWWSLALLAMLYLRQSQQQRWWMAIGVALGIGLLNKFSIAFIAVGIAIAALVSPRRRELLGRWPWLGAVIAIVIGSPSIVGQVLLDWPVREQMSALQTTQLARMSTAQFLFEQPLQLGGPAFLLAVGGLVWLLVSREVRWARDVAVAILVAIVLVMLGRGKAYYIGPVYPMLLAAGAAMTQRIWSRTTTRRVQLTCASLIIVAGIATFSMGVPVLPPQAMMRYTNAIGMTQQTNVGAPVDLPQDYADMLGWERLADSVAHVYRQLPTAERVHTIVVADNYGEAGALEYYAMSRGLPEVVSPAGSYWYFGPPRTRARTAIVVGSDGSDLDQYCQVVRLAAQIRDPILVPEERLVRIFECRDLKVDLAAAWSTLR